MSSGSWLTTLLDYWMPQPNRQKISVFAYNGNAAVEVSCERGLDGYTFYQSDIFTGLSALQLVRGYLDTKAEEVAEKFNTPGPLVVEGKEYTLNSILGKGGSCTVYEASTKEGQMVVLKVYETSKLREREEECLKLLCEKFASTELIRRIPKCLASEGVILVVTPRARHFCQERPFLSVHGKQLFDTLKEVHKNELVHRDVRPANFFWVDSDNILLNDWADTVQMGSVVHHEGTPLCYSMPGIDLKESYAASAQQDLYSFVLSCYAACNNFDARTAFPWEHGDLPEVWKNALAVAQSGNHDEVWNHVSLLLPKRFVWFHVSYLF